MNKTPIPETSQPKSSALPEQAISRLFARFEAMYGAKFADAWKGCDIRNVKAVWAETLGALSREELAAGVSGCMGREWPPTLPEFVKLCRQADPNRPGGHPSANEAWGLVLASQDETDTVVWNEQIAEAAGIAQPILDAGDEVGARMAFRDAYDRILRERADPPRGFPSLGRDPQRRTAAIDRAVRAGLLTQQHAAGLLPAPKDTGPIGAALFEGKPLMLADLSPGDRDRARRNIAKLKLILRGNEAA